MRKRRQHNTKGMEGWMNGGMEGWRNGGMEGREGRGVVTMTSKVAEGWEWRGDVGDNC